MKNPDVYVVSMDKDADKYARAKSVLDEAGFSSVTRARGVPGGALPSSACDILTLSHNYAVGKGALGCFLAHVAAWEQIASRTSEWAIVFEDDVSFQNLDRVFGAIPPSNADFIFCNNFMEPEPGFRPQDNGALQFLPITLSLQKMVRCRYNGIGTQGYLLTRIAADKLVSAVRKDGFFGHVDWRLMRYCTNEDIIDATIPGSHVSEVLRTHHNYSHPPAWGILNAYCASPHLVAHEDIVSNRRLEDYANVSAD